MINGPNRILYIGNSGSGKSFLIKRLLKEGNADEKTLASIVDSEDPFGETTKVQKH